MSVFSIIASRIACNDCWLLWYFQQPRIIFSLLFGAIWGTKTHCLTNTEQTCRDFCWRLCSRTHDENSDFDYLLASRRLMKIQKGRWHTSQWMPWTLWKETCFLLTFYVKLYFRSHYYENIVSKKSTLIKFSVKHLIKFAKK